MVKKSFPHPVLDPTAEDYPNCAIQFRAKMFSSPISYKFDVGLDLGSETLQSAIEAGNATYAVQVDCRWTSFRKVYKFPTFQTTIEIPENQLRDSVQVHPYILADREFTLKSEHEFHALFSAMSFPMRRGYVLAWDNPHEFFAEKTLDDLKNINAVMEVLRSKKVGVPVEYGLTGDKIEIFLPEADFEAYSSWKTNAAYRNSFMCMLALPAVAFALTDFLSAPESEKLSNRWGRVLQRRIADLKLPPDHDKDPLDLAQRILDLPITRAIQGIKSYEELATI
jgi:hypothetical protein